MRKKRRIIITITILLILVIGISIIVYKIIKNSKNETILSSSNEIIQDENENQNWDLLNENLNKADNNIQEKFSNNKTDDNNLTEGQSNAEASLKDNESTKLENKEILTSNKATSENLNSGTKQTSSQSQTSSRSVTTTQPKQTIQTTNQGASSATKNSSTQTKQTETTKTTEQPKQETKSVRCANNNNHSIPVGNCGKWFNSYSECEKEFYRVSKIWSDKVKNGEIDFDTYQAKAPGGFETFTCMYCGKYTMDIYYGNY